MKKAISLILALMLCISIAVPAFAADSDFVIENGVLTKYKGPGGAVTIPAGVTSIGERAFMACQSLTSVTIPDSVTYIGSGAFQYCGLTSVTIPNSVTSIENSTFINCSSLSSVTIPNSVTSIGSSAFSGCSSLTSVTIPSSVTSIGYSAFSGCKSMTSVTIPNSVTSIEGDAFHGCSSLTSVTIPNSVTSIGEYAFSGCESLTSVTIPGNVTSIGMHAFSSCTGLTSVTLPDSVTNVGNQVFQGCEGLADAEGFVIVKGVLYDYCGDATNVTIPHGVTRISAGAFTDRYQDRGLTSVIIPDSVTSIAGSAFFGCQSLTSVTIPVSVTSIGSMAFWFGPMRDVYYGGSEAQWEQIELDPINFTPETVIHYNSAAPSKPDGITVTVNGKAVEWTDAEPFINDNSRTMVPLRAVADAMGLTVDWDGKAREAVFSNGSKTLYFPIGSTTARTGDGGTVKMDTAAVIMNSRTYAPIRYLAEYFGYEVGWDGATKTVSLK